MVRKIFFIFIPILLVCIFLSSTAYAQYRSNSNKVTTRIGNPTTSQPGGRIDIPEITGNPRQAVMDQFGVTIDASHPDEYSIWAWEFLWEVSNTSFDERVRGTLVKRDDTGSWQENCKTINIRGSYDRSLFRIVFTHEMGHIIMNCPEGDTYRDAHNQARNEEGQLTIYSQQLCTYKNPGKWEEESENYADMIAYYLNYDVNSRTACGEEPNPYINGSNPRHKAVAEMILGTFP